MDEQLEWWNDCTPDRGVTFDLYQNFEDQSFEQWNDSSTLDEDEPNQKRFHQADLIDIPDNRKVAKAERKRAKHQAGVKVITEKDLQELDHALHPGKGLIIEQKRLDTSQGLAQNKAIENNISFNTHMFRCYSLGTDVHDKKLMKANRPHRGKELVDIPEQKKALVDPVLQRLGLSPNITRATKECKALNFKLREAMYDDIVAVTNEQTETMQRMAGYWRYANRRTYNAMVRMNEIWDW